MQSVLLIIHLFVVLALIGLVLMQRSEGGALGMGGSSQGLFSARGQANLLTRTTAILAALFFATSLVLAIMAGRAKGPASVFDQPAATQPVTPAAPAVPVAPAVPLSGGAAPAAPAKP